MSRDRRRASSAVLFLSGAEADFVTEIQRLISEFAESSMLVLSHGVRLHTQPAADFLGAHPVDNAPQEDLAIDGFESGHEALDRRHQFAEAVHGLGIGLR